MGKSKINRGRARREELRERADERATARAGRSNSEQIELLNARLGNGVGAVRERKRLGVDETGQENGKVAKTPGSTRSQRRKEKAARHRARRESES